MDGEINEWLRMKLNKCKISPPLPYDILLLPLAAPPAVPTLCSAHLLYTLLLLLPLLLHQSLQHLQRILEIIKK